MRRLRIVLLFALLLALIPAPALAFGGRVPDGQVVFGEDFTLAAGEILDGDLVVFGGDVTLEEGSEVNGDVVVWGGTVDVNGTVDGNLAALGGDVHLGASALITGDLVTMGGEIQREEGARVEGQEVTGVGRGWAFPVIIPLPGGARRIPIPSGPYTHWNGLPGLLLHLLLRGIRLVLLVFLMAGLSGLVVVLWPQPAARVGETALQALLPSLGVGLLTVVVAGVVVLGLIASLCLSPLALLVILAAGVAGLFGWTALGILVGERVVPALTSRPVSPFWSAALGGALLIFITELLDLIPCVGWIGGFLVTCVGVGAVVLTRFGTVAYPVAVTETPG
ncbi:MAG TPA: polymer-forming cytoskeletal protein [Chloroflexi bacterium]|nr:polymer-forming cytoskeletal protein [Chloroflexota bacterium]